MQQHDEILDSQQVADILGISRSYLYVFVKNGLIHPMPTHSAILKRPHMKFRRSEVNRFLEQETGVKVA